MTLCYITKYYQEYIRGRREYLTAQKLFRSSSILLYHCFDSNTPLCSTEHTQVYFLNSVCGQL